MSRNRITRVTLAAVVGPFKSDVRSGKREVTDLRQEAERFSKGRYTAKVAADTKPARTELSALEKRLQAFGKTPVDQRVNLDTDEARDRLSALQGRLAEFGSWVSDARVDLDDAQAQGKLSRIEAGLLRLGSRTAEADIDLEGVAAAEGELAALQARLASFNGSDPRAQVHLDGTLAATKQASAMYDAIAILGPAFIPVAAAATPALAGVTKGLGFAAVGAGTTALAFSGVGAALKALNTEQTASAQTSRETARQQILSAQQVADARRGVIGAERDAAQAARDGAQQVAEARRGVVQAEQAESAAAREGAREIVDAQQQVTQARRDAADAQATATQGVQDAEDALAAADVRVTDAEVALHEARRQAIIDLQDLREETRDNALTVEGAEISLARARQQLAELSASGVASELDLREARLSVAEAEDRVGDARQESRRDTDKLNTAEREGIRNSDGVVQARRELADAHTGVKDAQEAVVAAQLEAARVQQDSARQIADAIQGVADARRGAAQRNAQAAQQVSDAQRTLVQTTRDVAQSRAEASRRVAEAERTLQRAVATSRFEMSQQNTEAQDLAEKMAALGPAGRQFVRFLQDARPQLQQLQNIAQAGMFPGMQAGIEDLLDLMPRWKSIVDNTSTALGQLAREGGKALTDPFWRKFFRYIDDEANDTLLQMGRSLGNIAEGFAGVVLALDPMADDFGDSFLGMSRDFSKWGRNLGDNEGYKEFVRYVRRVSPDVWDTLGTVANTIVDIVEAAAPVGEVTLPIIRSLARVLGWIADSPAGPILIGAATGLSMINRAMRIADAAKYSRVGTLIGSMGSKAEGTQGKMGRLGKFLGSGGAWGLALGVGITALAFFWDAQEKADKRVQSLTDSLDKQTGQIRKNTVQQIINAAQKQGLYDRAAKVGISADVYTRALLGQDKALATVNAKLRDTIKNNSEWVSTGLTSAHVTKGLGRDAFQLQLALDSQNGALADSRKRWQDQREQQQLSDRVLKNTRDIWGDQNDTVRDGNKATGDHTSQLKKLADQLGLTDRQARTFIKSMKDEESASRGARGDGELHEKQLKQVADKLDLTRGETRDLISAYKDIPKDITTTGWFDDVKARKNVRDFKTYVQGKFRDLGNETYAIMVNGQSGHGRITQADGAIVRYYAGGGVDAANGHVAQIARDGVTRVWNERETGGELYAPLAPAKRGRSKQIMEQGASLMGGRIEWYQDGGVRGGQAGPTIQVKTDFSELRQLVRETVKSLQSAGGSVPATLAWAKRQVGDSYLMGGTGPNAWDCSGFMSGITHHLLGQDPVGPRLFATSTFPTSMFARGPGIFMIGSTRDAGDGIGHMAGTLGGVNVESSGDVGVHMGRSARGARDPLFGGNIWHLRQGLIKQVIAGGRGDPAAGFSGGGTPAQNRRLGHQMAANRGWTGPEWHALNELWGNRESGWRTRALNKSSPGASPYNAAYGIPQALPGSKMASAGRDWLTNPATQIQWGLGYIRGRYGDPLGALAHSNQSGWYDRGGWLQHNETAVNKSGKPEPVFSNAQWQLLKKAITALTMNQGRPVTTEWLEKQIVTIVPDIRDLHREFVRTRDAMRGFRTRTEQTRHALEGLRDTDRYHHARGELRRAETRLGRARSGKEIGDDIDAQLDVLAKARRQDDKKTIEASREKLKQLHEEREQLRKLRGERNDARDAKVLQRVEETEKKLTERIKEQTKARQRATQAAQAYNQAQQAAVESARDQAGQLLGGVDLFGGFVSAGGAQRQVDQAIQRIAEYGQIMAELRSRGVNPWLLAEFQRQGPTDAGIRLGRALLDDKQALSRLSDSAGALNDLTNRVGSVVGDPRFMSTTPWDPTSVVSNRELSISIEALDVSRLSGEIRRQVEHVVNAAVKAGSI